MPFAEYSDCVCLSNEVRKVLAMCEDACRRDLLDYFIGRHVNFPMKSDETERLARRIAAEGSVDSLDRLAVEDMWPPTVKIHIDAAKAAEEERRKAIEEAMDQCSFMW